MSGGTLSAQMAGFPICCRRGQRGWNSAAGRRVHRAGHVAHQDHALATEGRIRDRDRRHQCLGVRVLLLPEEFATVGELGDAPEIHDRDPVADVLDDTHVVSDEDVRQPELALELLQQVQDLGLDRHVQGRHGLVTDDEVGLEDQRPGDADALALAAGEFVRIASSVIRTGGRPGPSSWRPSRDARLQCRDHGCAGPRRCCRRSAFAGRGSRTGPGRSICIRRR